MIIKKIDCTEVVTIHQSDFLDGAMKFKKKVVNPYDSETTLATHRYFASALDRDNVGCCLADQEIRLLLRYTHNPNVELRVSGYPPQSASMYDNKL